MKTFIITYCISEEKLNKIIARKTSPTAKEQVKKLFPVIPLVFTFTNRNGDKDQVDNWTREIKGTRTLLRKEKGYLFYESRLEVPNYVKMNTSKYEEIFEKFVRDYMAKNNSLVGLMFITGKFYGNVSIIAAAKDNIKEKKENYVDNPISQIKEQSKEYGDFFKENKKLIIGGSIALVALVSTAIILK